MSLLGKPAPAFVLPTLTGGPFASESLAGSVTLLDFWEVWCGPCLESMPKIQRLADTYAVRGLQVVSIIHELKQKDVAKRMLAKRGATFPMLLGTNRSKRDYQVNAIPLYVLVDRRGVVAFISEGFSPELEEAIQKLLNE